MRTNTEYIVVADMSQKILGSFLTYSESVTFASMLRQAGAKVTIFKSLEVRKTKKEKSNA